LDACVEVNAGTEIPPRNIPIEGKIACHRIWAASLNRHEW